MSAGFASVRRPISIISGGQTGVDRAALDAALAAGVPCGGWCPPGRAAEDGPIPARYPLRELAEGGYLERTRANVDESDGTAVIHAGDIEGGTAQTVVYCAARSKPHLILDSSATAPAAAAKLLREFIERHHVAVLNIAGPRASKQPEIYAYARAVITLLLKPPEDSR